MKDVDLKICFGKLLGEVYRLQQHVGMDVEEGVIDNLLDGNEEVIDEILSTSLLTSAQISHVADVLTPFIDDSSKLESLDGYYQLKNKLDEGGVDDYTTMRVFQYFLRSSSFTEVIEKICTGYSPVGFKNLLKSSDSK